MQKPSPGPEHAALARLAGHWSGTETMMPSPWSPETSDCTGTIRARLMDGFFVISDYEQHKDGAVHFRGHGVYSWDPEAKHYVMYWFDSMGGAGAIATGTLDGDQLTFENSSPMGRSRYRYTLGETTQRFEMSVSQDGASWQTLMVGEYRSGTEPR